MNIELSSNKISDFLHEVLYATNSSIKILFCFNISTKSETVFKAFT